MAFRIEKFSEEFDLSIFSNFDCRNEEYHFTYPDVQESIRDLCDFPKSSKIRNSLAESIGVPRVAFDDELKLGIGYYSLACCVVKSDEVGPYPALVDNWPFAPFYPAIRISVLAVHKAYQGRPLIVNGENLGKYSDIIMDDITKNAKLISKSVGARFLYVNASATPNTLYYYSKPRHSFKPIASEEHLFDVMVTGNKYKGINSLIHQPHSSVAMFLDLMDVEDVNLEL